MRTGTEHRIYHVQRSKMFHLRASPSQTCSRLPVVSLALVRRDHPSPCPTPTSKQRVQTRPPAWHDHTHVPDSVRQTTPSSQGASTVRARGARACMLATPCILMPDRLHVGSCTCEPCRPVEPAAARSRPGTRAQMSTTTFASRLLSLLKARQQQARAVRIDARARRRGSSAWWRRWLLGGACSTAVQRRRRGTRRGGGGGHEHRRGAEGGTGLSSSGEGRTFRLVSDP